MTYGARPEACSCATTSATTGSSLPTATMGSSDGTSRISAPYNLSSNRLPATAGTAAVDVSTSTERMPATQAAAAVMRA
jgi:hypothetical protein